MINYLRVAKTANFHSLKRRLSNAAVDQLFRAVRAAHVDVSQNLFSHRRVAAGNSRWSAICLTYHRPVAFFEEEAGVTECICGFLLMVEHRDHLAVFKSRLDLPAGFITRYLGRIAADRVTRLSPAKTPCSSISGFATCHSPSRQCASRPSRRTI